MPKLQDRNVRVVVKDQESVELGRRSTRGARVGDGLDLLWGQVSDLDCELSPSWTLLAFGGLFHRKRVPRMGRQGLSQKE